MTVASTCPAKPNSLKAVCSIWLTFFLVCTSLCPAFAQSGSVVTVNSDNVLVLNGRKVFVLGFSPGPPTNGKTPTGDDALQEMRDAGALLFRMNQTGNWSSQVITQQQAALDWAAQHDMYCWVNLRELSEFPSTDTNTPASLRNIVDTFRNHPALGLWKNFDEAWWSGVSWSNLLNGYLVIRQEDTNHPVVQTHAPRGTVADLQPYNVAADVLAVDIYPVATPPPSNPPLTNTNISVVGDWTGVIGQVANGQKQYWTIEQIAFSGTTPPSHTLIFPTFTQSRYMAYQAILNGARGLMFFGGNVAATLNAQDTPLGWNWTFWTNVLKPVVQQLGDHGVLTGALTTTNSSLPVTFTGTTSPDLEYCVREVPPYLYIIAAKREGTNVTITFNGLPSWAGAGEVLYESPRTVTAHAGQFTDAFAPFDVHVYRFSQSNQAPSIVFQSSSRTNLSGTTVTFNVSADGTGPLTYRWRKNGLNLSDGGNVSGAGSTALTLSSVLASNGGAYDVVATGFGSITSSPAISLTVITNQPPTITGAPQSQTNNLSTIAAFSVTATGSGPLAYQWRKNGTNLSDGGIISGASTSALTLAGVSAADAGNYDVVVNGFGSVTSTPPAVLTVLLTQTNWLILYEPFNYTNIGGPVSSNNPANWTYGGSPPNDLSVVNTNLSYPGLAPALGYSVTNGADGLGVRRLFGTSVNTGTLYFSALFRISNLGYGVWNGASSYAGALCATDNTSFKLGVMVKSNSASGYVFGVQKSGTGATTTFDATEHHAGETVFLVGKYDFTVSPNSVTLWIDPAASTFGAPADPASGFISATTGTDGYILDRFNMRQNTASSVPAAMQWDELRIGTSWAVVTPPPSPPLLTSPTHLPSGGFQFTYANTAGSNYSVYASTNFVNWTSLGAATQTTPGYFQFTDPAAAGYPRRFYRLHSP
jgi:hypothetical protein